jgi:SAM-dependent methyltransferase
MIDDSDNIKEEIKKRYGKIAVLGNTGSCCMPSGCCNDDNSASGSPITSAEAIGYTQEELTSIPHSSILGVGCGNPTKFSHVKEGDIVVDLGSGAGIDVFLAANVVKDNGKVIGVDMTGEMIEKAMENAKIYNYTNVEFRHGDIEKRIPVDDNSADVVISNCVINLTSNKANTFKEIHRILKPKGVGRMVISDLVISREVNESSLDVEDWCSCIDGALTKENYVDAIKKSGFTKVEILDEKPYMAIEGKDGDDGRKITSLVIKATKE